uniref:vitamin B12 dependent-methionine synthase activation domain-containing protein n=1 Tax=Prevotella sp. TaxID=59823 RepID=UPI004024D8D7
MNKTYRISELIPFINWLYFYHAWGLSGKPKADKEKIKQEALQMLASWEEKYHTHAIFKLFEVGSEGDDLIFFLPSTSEENGISGTSGGNGTPGTSGIESNGIEEKKEKNLRFPMLRQQHPSAPGEPNLCLADFIRPLSQGIRDQIGVFCTSVDGTIIDVYRHDDYLNMMAQTLSDRLAEATAEKLHEEVRREYWGYAPDENLTIEQQHREEYQGIRPAIGYPSLPDTSANFIIDKLLDMKQAGIRLTETGMMTPHASVSGLMFSHPKARYFELGKIGDDQLRDYARRRGVPVELMRRFLQSSLIKK